MPPIGDTLLHVQHPALLLLLRLPPLRLKPACAAPTIAIAITYYSTVSVRSKQMSHLHCGWCGVVKQRAPEEAVDCVHVGGQGRDPPHQRHRRQAAVSTPSPSSTLATARTSSNLPPRSLLRPPSR
jgi:hypothetical protein